jgi:hypothetical protein
MQYSADNDNKPYNPLEDVFDNPNTIDLPSARVSGRSNTRFEKVDGAWVPIKRQKSEPRPKPTRPRPDIAVHGEWVGDEFYPDTRFHRKPNVAIDAAKADDKILERRQRVRLGRRAAIGKDWDGADNDNEDFPLLAALRREKDNDSIEFVLAYRRLVALAECEPLQGQRAGGDIDTVHVSTNLSEQTEEILAKAKEDNWNVTSLPGGEIRYKHVRKRKGGTFHLPAMRAVAANDETRVRTAPLPVKFNCDILIELIDAKPVLEHIRQSLGPLCDILEDAVLGACSYTDIGRRKGAKAKPDETGRVLVKWAITIAEDALHNAVQIIRREEKKSERRAVGRRIEIELERARYLGKAA